MNVDPQDMGRKEKKDQLAGGNPLSAVKYKEIKIEGKEYLIMDESDIMAVIEK